MGDDVDINFNIQCRLRHQRDYQTGLASDWRQAACWLGDEVRRLWAVLSGERARVERIRAHLEALYENPPAHPVSKVDAKRLADAVVGA